MLYCITCCCYPFYFVDHSEKSSKEHAFYLQKETAKQAAKELAAYYEPLKAFLLPIDQRALSWQAERHEAYDDDISLYVPPGQHLHGLFAEEKGHSKAKMEMVDELELARADSGEDTDEDTAIS
jgi:hypothetical protein